MVPVPPGKSRTFTVLPTVKRLYRCLCKCKPTIHTSITKLVLFLGFIGLGIAIGVCAYKNSYHDVISKYFTIFH